MRSQTTSLPSCSSDLAQALLALRELAEAVGVSTDPLTVSALQQARTVLRRHDRDQSSEAVPATAATGS